eukprot:12693977-Alexandrium_andersonii.AAC.1
MGHRRLFKAAWLECKGWLHTLRVLCDVPMWTRARMSWPRRADYPDMSGKAYTCRCVVAWLAK